MRSFYSPDVFMRSFYSPDIDVFKAISRRHSFSIGGESLISNGGFIIEPPKHTVALRDIEFVSSYGNEDDIIDNGRYKNVSFDLTIGFRRDLSPLNGDVFIQKIKAWLSTLTAEYQKYTETYNKGWFTNAVLTAIDAIVKTNRVFWETKLTFTRRPYWYEEGGSREIPLQSGEEIKLYNPSGEASLPTLILRRGNNASSKQSVTVNGTRLDFSPTASCTEVRFEGEEKRHIAVSPNGLITQIDGVLPPELFPKGKANVIKALSTGSGDAFAIIPNWRRL